MQAAPGTQHAILAGYFLQYTGDTAGPRKRDGRAVLQPGSWSLRASFSVALDRSQFGRYSGSCTG